MIAGKHNVEKTSLLSDANVGWFLKDWAQGDVKFALFAESNKDSADFLRVRRTIPRDSTFFEVPIESCAFVRKRAKVEQLRSDRVT